MQELRAATFIGASLLSMSVVCCVPPLVTGLALVTSSLIMSAAHGASPLVMSVVSLVMCVAYGQTQFPVSGAAYNFGASLFTKGIVLSTLLIKGIVLSKEAGILKKLF